MPSADTLKRFIALVEANQHVEAIEQFYAPHASMQENDLPPRTGRPALVANERAVLAKARWVKSTCVRPAFTNGDHVVIRWIFEFEWLDGRRTRLDEIAWQRWEGDRIVEEKFFYDPRQLQPQAPRPEL
ncbi:MAG: nuclear transport factor 2 family protein [Betaproteobacteria bacterium]|nr:MAG: nuclear transport factor 2 family protein [Betaproteobacteria bacterium]